MLTLSFLPPYIGQGTWINGIVDITIEIKVLTAQVSKKSVLTNNHLSPINPYKMHLHVSLGCPLLQRLEHHLNYLEWDKRKKEKKREREGAWEPIGRQLPWVTSLKITWHSPLNCTQVYSLKWFHNKVRDTKKQYSKKE